ncbi:MAG: hypothetical protein JW937_05160, partial [Candidatus Omnitrophica bacterium]|nr:hypothetical protein [Candidatus Omnitrophota bacterium]
LLSVLAIERMFQQVFGYSQFAVTLVAVALISFLFMPLRNYLQKLADRYMWKGSAETLSQENERLQEELIHSERLKAMGTLAAGMAHEIKNPLTAIQTFTEYLPEKHNDPKFIQQFQAVVGPELDRISRISKQLLAFGKPAAPQIEKLDPAASIDEVLELLSSDFLRRGIRVEKCFESSANTLQADPQQLKQAILNICLNAKEAMPEGGTLRISLRKGVKSVELSFEDTGTGIASKDLKKIWDPFFSTKDKGTGLGLSVVHNIVRAHGGKADIISGPGGGTTVRIILPC